MLDQKQQKNINKFIKKALGVRFLDQGREVFSGLDCWGLILLAYRQIFGLELPDLAGVPALDFTQVHDIFAACRRTWLEVPQGQERPGDVALFRRGRWIAHAGLVIAPGHVLHVEPGIDTCVEPFYRDPLRLRLVGVYRHAEFV